MSLICNSQFSWLARILRCTSIWRLDFGELASRTEAANGAAIPEMQFHSGSPYRCRRRVLAKDTRPGAKVRTICSLRRDRLAESTEVERPQAPRRWEVPSCENFKNFVRLDNLVFHGALPRFRGGT